jgi:hypothetical protein
MEKEKSFTTLILYLKAGTMVMGLSPAHIMRFGDVVSIEKTGIDCLWSDIEGEDQWSIRETYQEINLLTGEDRTVTEVITTGPVEEEYQIAKGALISVLERKLDNAFSNIDD